MAKRTYVYTGTAWEEISSTSAVPTGSTTVTGIVQLTDSTSSTSTTTAATPNSVKSAYDLATTANSTAGAAIPNSTVTTAGDTLYATGASTVTRLAAGAENQVLMMGASSVPAWSYRPPLVTNSQSGTSYTLQLSDAGKMVEFTSSAAVALTVPTNSVAAFPVGTQIDLSQIGSGQVTVSGASVTLQSNGSKLKLNGQYAAATLIKRATDTWLLVGNLTV